MNDDINSLDLRSMAGRRWARYQNTLKANNSHQRLPRAGWVQEATNMFLDLRKPSSFSDKEWGMFCNDVRYIAESYGDTLGAMGWSPVDIFSCDPIDPLDCSYRAGLCARLRGRQIGLIGERQILIREISDERYGDYIEVFDRLTNIEAPFFLWDLNGKQQAPGLAIEQPKIAPPANPISPHYSIF